MTKPTLDEIHAQVASTVADIIRDWSLDVALTPETRLSADLGFTSMDLIDLCASLDIRFMRKFPYESFFAAEGGGYRPDMSLGDLAAFLQEHFDTGRQDLSAV